MKVRRIKPYVCVDIDFADHSRFQATSDLEAAAGVWLRCLAHSRAQEQDGVVLAGWLRRTFATTYTRVDELVRVGLLRLRPDGDYELHAYAPRNQTRAMLVEDRSAARERMAAHRASARTKAQVCSPEQAANEQGTNAFVPTSTSPLSLGSSVSSLSASSERDVDSVPRALAPAPAERWRLPPSERALSGSFWLAAFSDGIREQTGRPCTVARFYVETLERIVTHHAPSSDAPSATAWLKDQARAFAAKWDGKHPPKGLTPDGLERWLNEGRQGPPVFGRPRIVQPPAAEWREDDWSDLGATVAE